MTIRTKLLVSFLVLVLMASTGGIYSFLVLRTASGYISAKQQVYNVQLVLKEARNTEKDFLLNGRKGEDFLREGESQLTVRHRQLIDSARRICQMLKEQDAVKDNHLEVDIYDIYNIVNIYDAKFGDLRMLLHERGFKDFGIEGTMRENVHQLQECISDQEKVYAYSLRRHEKDFMLRRDLRYFEKLRETLHEFMDFVHHSNMPHMTPAYKAGVVAVAEDYLSKFERLVAIEEAIGLDEKSGLQGELHKSAMAIEPAVQRLLHRVGSASVSLQRRAAAILVCSILVPLILGVLISVFLNKKIAIPISSLNKIIRNIIKGKKSELKKLDEITSKDEIGDLAINFRQMMEMLNRNLAEISEKNLQLETASVEEGRRKWMAEGIAGMIDTMKKYDTDLKEFSYQLISKLVNYLDANQGGIFFTDDIDEPTKMILHGAHAYDRRKFTQKEVLRGEGVIGTAWMEKGHVLMTDIPSEYIAITSGLGEATPNTLLVVPVKYEEKVLGAIEIASFKRLKDYEIDFVNKIADRIAATYFSIVTQEKTRKLLEHSQLQAETMRAQEEELRQNMEELKATQENMKKKQFETEAVRRMLDNIIDLVPYPIFVKDHQFRYTLVNKAEAILYNTSSEKMLNKDDSFFIYDDTVLRGIRQSDKKVLEDRKEFRLPEQMITFPNGTKKILQTIKVPFVNPVTEQVNILGISLDVTEVRSVETQLKSAHEALSKAREEARVLESRMEGKEDINIFQQ